MNFYLNHTSNGNNISVIFREFKIPKNADVCYQGNHISIYIFFNFIISHYLAQLPMALFFVNSYFFFVCLSDCLLGCFTLNNNINFNSRVSQLQIITISASLFLQENVVALIEGTLAKTSACTLSEVTGIPLIRLRGDIGPLDQCEKAIQMSAGYRDYAHATLDVLNELGWKNVVLIIDGKLAYCLNVVVVVVVIVVVVVVVLIPATRWIWLRWSRFQITHALKIANWSAFFQFGFLNISFLFEIVCFLCFNGMPGN